MIGKALIEEALTQVATQANEVKDLDDVELQAAVADVLQIDMTAVQNSAIEKALVTVQTEVYRRALVTGLAGHVALLSSEWQMGFVVGVVAGRIEASRSDMLFEKWRSQ